MTAVAILCICIVFLSNLVHDQQFNIIITATTLWYLSVSSVRFKYIV